MTLITTKVIKKLANTKEQSVILKSGGTSLSAYYQPVELLERKHPIIQLISPEFDCLEQEENALHEILLKVSLENSVATDIKLTVFLYGSTEIKEYTLQQREIIDISLLVRPSSIISNSNIKVVITGKDVAGKDLEFIKDFKIVYEPGCDLGETVPSCISNSSQVLYRVERLGSNYKIKIDNDPVKICTDINEFVNYMSSKGYAVNFYKEVL